MDFTPPILLRLGGASGLGGGGGSPAGGGGGAGGGTPPATPPASAPTCSSAPARRCSRFCRRCWRRASGATPPASPPSSSPASASSAPAPSSPPPALLPPPRQPLRAGLRAGPLLGAEHRHRHAAHRKEADLRRYAHRARRRRVGQSVVPTPRTAARHLDGCHRLRLRLDGGHPLRAARLAAGPHPPALPDRLGGRAAGAVAGGDSSGGARPREPAPRARLRLHGEPPEQRGPALAVRGFAAAHRAHRQGAGLPHPGAGGGAR